jgi:hypothetical protein
MSQAERAVAEARKPARERTEASRQAGLRSAARAVLDYCGQDREAAAQTARAWADSPGGDNRWKEVATIIEKGTEKE